MPVVNKYNIHWQVVRVKAKAEKNVDIKVRYVLDWYYTYPSKANFKRIENWLKMSPLGYKLQSVKQIYRDALAELELQGYEEKLEDQFEYQFERYTFKELKQVLRDVKKRKYNFKYNGAPKSHYDFVIELERYLLSNNGTYKDVKNGREN